MAAKKTKTTVTEDITTEVVEEVKEKTFEPEDLIPCRSLVSGALYIEGARSKSLYNWADYGDIVEVEYRDLDYMIRANSKAVYEPRIIIEDDDIVNKHSRIASLYESLYSVNDLRDIINLDAHKMKKVVDELPSGAINALKGVVATMIDNKQLDSITKIKILDEALGTNMLVSLVAD